MMYPLSHPTAGLIRRGLAVSALALLIGACSSDQGQQEQPPAQVTTTEVKSEPARHRVAYPGRLRGQTEVEVRARVSGILEERRYEEGREVEAGQTLFQIEPDTYEDAVKAAKADLAEAEAQRLRTEREWERVSGLYERDAVSERERDQARADHRAAQSRLEAAESALNNAERELRYARVEAPINGITSIESVTEGNLVEPGTLLTHIVQHDPMQVYFSLPEDDAAAQRLARKAQQASGDDSERSVQLVRRDGSEYRESGTVDFADRRIDPMTGSVQMRAVFPNPDRELIPGQFVRIKITLEEYDSAILIDPTAVTQGPEGPQVFTVGEDSTARAHPVELGPMIEGRRLIAEGLESGSQLVVNGQVALQDGAAVNVSNGDGQEE